MFRKYCWPDKNSKNVIKREMKLLVPINLNKMRSLQKKCQELRLLFPYRAWPWQSSNVIVFKEAGHEFLANWKVLRKKHRDQETIYLTYILRPYQKDSDKVQLRSNYFNKDSRQSLLVQYDIFYRCLMYWWNEPRTLLIYICSAWESGTVYQINNETFSHRQITLSLFCI